MKILSPDQILARLEQALPLLDRWALDVPERQRTLAATIAWSYEMLSDPEQRLFARLSVFAGGCTLEAAETVVRRRRRPSRLARGQEPGPAVEAALLDARDDQGVRPRAPPRARRASTRSRRRHADYFLAGAEANYGEIFESLTQDQLHWFEREQDNLRAALDRAP